MILARIVGTVVATRKDDRLHGRKLLVARLVDADGNDEKGHVIAVDTVGAGDAFGGAFLTWWAGNGLSRSDLGEAEAVRGATQAAILASVVTTTRRGAEPPWAYELAGHDGWRWLPPGDPPG